MHAHHTQPPTQLYRDCLRVADHIASKVSKLYQMLASRLPLCRLQNSPSLPSLRLDLPLPFFLTQSPKGIALRNMLRSEFKNHANVEDGKQVEQLKMK